MTQIKVVNNITQIKSAKTIQSMLQDFLTENQVGSTIQQIIEADVTNINNLIIQQETYFEQKFMGRDDFEFVIGLHLRTVSTGLFYKCKNVKQIFLPNIIEIEEWGFGNCDSLIKFSSNTLQTVGKGSFSSCKKLQSVSFPRLESIEKYAFQNCKSLSEISCQQMKTIDKGGFLNCSSLISVSFPALQRIGENAFQDCTSLSEISCQSLTIVGQAGFLNCSQLFKASFPVLESIEKYAFAQCTSLIELDTPQLKQCGVGAFWKNGKLETISSAVVLELECKHPKDETKSCEFCPVCKKTLQKCFVKGDRKYKFLLKQQIQEKVSKINKIAKIVKKGQTIQYKAKVEQNCEYKK